MGKSGFLLNLRSGYWQAELEEEVKPLTVFTVWPLGLWECERIHFGIQAIIEWPRPTTVTEVRPFIGFVSYYRRFIFNTSRFSKPLNQLLLNLEGTFN